MLRRRWNQTAMTIPARHEPGVFKPLEDVKIEEGTVVEVHVPPSKLEKPASIRDLGFATMWAGRDEIGDGLSYVNNLRDHPRS
jgi:predicted DNA-binding antitoxin AbrB/MazE fold protein